MHQLASILFYLGVVAYSGSATLFFVDLTRQGQTNATAQHAARILAVGTVAHGLYLLIESFAIGRCPVGSLPFAVSFSALITSTVYLVMRTRTRMDAIGVVVSPLALMFMVGAQFIARGGPPPSLPHTLVVAHIFANVLGVGLFLLAGAASAFYLFQEGRLKAKRATSLQGKLPPLDTLDSTEHRLLLAGFPLLTFGVVTGAVFASHLEAMTRVAVLRSALGYAAWVLLALVLVLRAVAGWRGRRAAYGTLAAVACVVVVIGIYAVQAAGVRP